MTKRKEVCLDCDGKGYAVFTADHTAYIRGEKHPLDLPEIERCDVCRKFSGDDEAQEQFLKDVVKGKVKLPRYLLLWGKKKNSKKTNLFDT
jgi:hypothetical protein